MSKPSPAVKKALARFQHRLVEVNLERMKAAILHLANHAPLDLMGPSEMQQHLRAIAGEPHVHKASIGPNRDQCDICLCDIRNEVHIKVKP